jgi:glycosyltransferase involved in cell wall biosynthesis
MAKKIDKKVRFFGFIKGQELLELYQSAKIFVFPSIQENFPVVLLEGMNANCAVITTTAAGCAEVVQDAGIKVEPGYVEELRTAIKQLIEDQSEIDRFVELGKKRLNELSWQTIAKFYENILVEHTRLGGVQDLSHLVQQKTTSISSSVG